MNTLQTTEFPSSWRPTLVVVSCCSTGHAMPGPVSDGITRATVRFADLNLSVLQDIAELYRRIEYAAGKVCCDHLRDRAVCTRKAVASAVMKIDRPALTEFHRGRLSVGSPG